MLGVVSKARLRAKLSCQGVGRKRVILVAVAGDPNFTSGATGNTQADMNLLRWSLNLKGQLCF